MKFLKHVLILAAAYSVVLFASHRLFPLLGTYNQAIIDFLIGYEPEVDAVVDVFLYIWINLIIRWRKQSKLGRIASNAGLFLCVKTSAVPGNAPKSKCIQRMKRPFLLVKDKIGTHTEKKFIGKISKDRYGLRIIAASGWATFGDEKSTFHQAVKNCSAAKIILLNPHSRCVDTRAQDLKKDLTGKSTLTSTGYRQDIYKCIDFLTKESQDPNRDIRLKFYDTYPGWKIIIFADSFLWVQRYVHSTHVQYTPRYAFDAKETSMLHLFSYHFQRYWKSRHLWEYDFTTGKIKRAQPCSNEDVEAAIR